MPPNAATSEPSEWAGLNLHPQAALLTGSLMGGGLIAGNLIGDSLIAGILIGGSLIE